METAKPAPKAYKFAAVQRLTKGSELSSQELCAPEAE